MKTPHQYLRKSYAMRRMAKAIERAIVASTGVEKERAARWAAAWGVLCGIKTEGMSLRRHAPEPASTATQRYPSETTGP